LYKCHACGKQFLGRERIENDVLWEQYVHGKQTYQQLSEKHQCSVRTIQRRLCEIAVVKTEKKSREVIILMDTTYWGRGFGVMLSSESYSN